MRESHQRLAPEHLLKAIMDDDQGLASNLIRRAGGEPQRVTEALALALAKLPKVSGDAQPFMDPGLVKVLDEAEKLAKKAGDSEEKSDEKKELSKLWPQRMKRLT